MPDVSVPPVSLLATPSLETMAGLLGVSSARARFESQLPAEARAFLSGNASFAESLAQEAARANTVSEFEEARRRVLDEYALLLVSVATMLHRIVGDIPMLQAITGPALEEKEARLSKRIAERWGEELAEDTHFVLSALRKTLRIAGQIAASPAVPEHERQQDTAIALDFFRYAVWAAFHLQCLLIADAATTEPPREVMSEIQSGMRSFTGAYHSAKQALALRQPATPKEPAIPAWDAEDQELLDTSTRDMAAETL